jgi:short-subunit dehydrogenase
MKNKIVVITGASAGIGAALAEWISSREGNVVIAARRAAELESVALKCLGRALAVVGDMGVRADVERVKNEALKKFGRVDAWVNNVGRGISRTVSELTDEDIDDMMRINVKSALYGMQTIVPHFKSQNHGHLINVSSMLGRVPFAPIRSAYSASKHFLNSLTANMRMEPQATHPNIFVTLFSPGVVATDFGLNSKHGGPDSRSFPFSQSAEEVAEVIGNILISPRADVYSRAQFQEQVVNYYSAADMGAAEKLFGNR